MDLPRAGNGLHRDHRNQVDLVPDPPVEELGVRDTDDTYLVSLARRNNCDFIVTGDKDLLEWERQEPRCITPASFAELW